MTSPSAGIRRQQVNHQYALDILEQFCETDVQLETLRKYFECNCNGRKTARKLGINESTLRGTLNRIKGKAAKSGYSPEEDRAGLAPPGFAVKGKSILSRVQVGTDGDGNPINELVWTKTAQDQEQMEMLAREAIKAFASEVKPTKPIQLRKAGPEELLNLFIVTDYHLGMKAWGEETRGEDWDIAIAEKLLIDWFDVTIDRMMPAKTAILGQLGDFLHWDGLDAVTPTQGHILDADTRFQKMVRVAIRALRRVTQRLLETHEHVHIIHAEGNHDLASSVWLRELFHAFYADEPRVTVDISADPYYVYQHGKTGLFFHHGHKKRFPSLDQVFVRKFRDIYGSVEHAYGHTGHLHHDKIESNLMTLEQHRTLAAADAYASRHGFMSGRDAKAITYHKEYGEVSRVTVNPDMVRAAKSK
jgi:hypothetical protein